jgi:hypothetical protein
VYGEPGTDVPVTRRLEKMRDVLAIAVRYTKAEHLLRLKPGSIPLTGLHGLYREAELLDLHRTDFLPKKVCTR